MAIINDEIMGKTIASLLGNKKIVKLNGETPVKVGEILEYKVNDRLYFYKIIKDGTIRTPNEEHCKRIMLGSGESFEDIKKKIFIG